MIFIDIYLALRIFLWFFGAMSSNGCRLPVTARISWLSATVGGCRI